MTHEGPGSRNRPISFAAPREPGIKVQGLPFNSRRRMTATIRGIIDADETNEIYERMIKRGVISAPKEKDHGR